MDRQQLLDRLRELHDELQSPTAIDAEERELLQDLAKDIEALLDDKEERQTLGSASLTSRLQEAALRLEASHPRATGLIGEVVDMLVKLGI